MLEHSHRPIAPTLALVFAACAFQTALAVPQSEPEPPVAFSSSLDWTAGANGKTLDAIRELISDGDYVRARLAVALVLRSPDRLLSDEERVRAHQILQMADSRIGRMDPFEVSLRHSAISFEDGDLATASRHASAVLANDSASDDQSVRATDILSSISIERASLAPFVSDAIAQIRENFENRDYARAKSNLDAIHRASVVLTDEQRDLVEMYRSMIVRREEVLGAPFAMSRVSLGVVQPDTVTRRGEEEQPETDPPAGELEDLPDAQPEVEPETQPEGEGEGQPEQVGQPEAGMDLIQVAMRAEAMGILGESNRSFDQNNWVKAQSGYRQLQDEYSAYLSDEQRSHVSSKLERIAIELNQPVGNQIEDVIRLGAVVRSQTEAEFKHLMSNAKASLRSGDLAGARASQAEARLIINSRRQYFNESQYTAFDRQVEDLRSDIDRASLEKDRREARERTERFEKDARDAQKQTASDREREISELIDRARSYQAEGRYEEALQTIERLLFRDPNNASGLLLQDVYQDILIFTAGRRIQQQKPYGFGRMTLENQAASMPPPGIVNYSPDWRAISLKRGELAGFQDTPENASIYADLRNTRIPEVILDSNSLEDVVRYIESITSHNIDVDWAELADISIQPETTTTLRLRGVSVATLLDRVLDKVSTDEVSAAAWEVRDGIISISSDTAIRRHTHLYIYDIKDLLLDIPDYDDVPDIDLQQSLQQSQGGGGGGGGQSPFDNDDDDDNDEDRRTLEERTQDIIDIITSNVDFDGWVDNGGETGTIQNYNGSLIITNTVANHAQVHGLLQQLRAVRAMQINVETRFLLVNQGFFEQIGFDLDVYWNANNNQFRAARALDPTILPSDFFGPGGQPLREVTGTASGIDLNRNFVIDPGEGGDGTTPVTQGVTKPRNTSIIGTPQNSLGLAEALLPASGIAATVLGAAPAISLVGSFVDDIQVDFLVKATQADQRSVALTAPRLTFMNGQIANIFVATQQAYVSDLTVVTADSAVGFDPTISVVTEGVTMVIEGVISSDRRYVTMNVDVGLSRIDGFASQPVTAVAGGQLINSADTSSFVQLPMVTVTRVRTSVTVPDQGTVLLGGQRITTEFEVETGVPVLSKIPILNRFFSNRIKSRDEQTLLILIRPTVLIQSELEEENSPGLNDLMNSGFGTGG